MKGNCPEKFPRPGSLPSGGYRDFDVAPRDANPSAARHVNPTQPSYDLGAANLLTMAKPASLTKQRVPPLRSPYRRKKAIAEMTRRLFGTILAVIRTEEVRSGLGNAIVVIPSEKSPKDTNPSDRDRFRGQIRQASSLEAKIFMESQLSVPGEEFWSARNNLESIRRICLSTHEVLVPVHCDVPGIDSQDDPE